jgi:hypothetical protein
MTKSIIEKLHENHRGYRKKVDEIRRDWTMSDAAKDQQIRTLYEEARSAYSRLTGEYRSSLEAELKRTRSEVFSPPQVSKDAALNTMAYRDALDRVGSSTDPRHIKEMLQRAELTGAVALARACLYAGYTNLSSDQAKVSVVDAYFRAFAADQPKWEAYMDAAEATNALESMGISAAVGVPAPEQPQTVAPIEAAAS